MSEIITSEILAEEFNPLVFETRSLLFGTRQGDVLGNFTVTEHTDTRTVMSAGNPAKWIVHFVVEDVSQGLFARGLESRMTADGMITEDNTVLLSTPNTSRMLSAKYGSMTKTMHRPMHDINLVLDQIASRSTPLTHEVAGKLYTDVHELLGMVPEHRPPEIKQRPPESSPPFGRLFRRHVSHV